MNRTPSVFLTPEQAIEGFILHKQAEGISYNKVLDSCDNNTCGVACRCLMAEGRRFVIRKWGTGACGSSRGNV